MIGQKDCTLIDYVDEACYGNGHVDTLQPTCPAGEVIYPKDIYTYCKRIETNCPHISYDGIRNETYCCRYVNETEDCGMRYYGVDQGLEHYRKFTGESIGSLQVAWNDTDRVCNQSIFFPKTHYMRMTYNCIKSSQIVSMCNSSASGDQLFLWNDGYPNSDGGCGLTSGCQCTIQSTGGSGIQIDALDIRFAINESTGLCSQRLYVIDGSDESDIACDDVNLFERRTLYTSLTDTIQLRYDNTYDGSNGNFWILLLATDNSQTLTITCSEVLLTNTEYNCGENFTIISPETEPTTTDTVTTNSEPDYTSMPTTTPSSSTSKSTHPVTEALTSSLNSDATFPTDATDVTDPTDVTDSTDPTDPTDVTNPTDAFITKATSSSSNTSTSSSPGVSEASTEEKSASKGPVIGAIIGVVAALAAAGLIGYTIWRKKFKGKGKVSPDDEYTDLFDTGAVNSQPPESYRPLPL
ncbi:Hypothetical predicted protein [Mytilus galloprovincialis]|uniref:Uncharacterized protein n=1 Tax=Mytilus galloprovincialis TaxID=29158 RepID=A0A8B6CFU2_MYTGA|nr:Hypothetical predicted protein [Mytilus galloprovincialis]VDI03361.1 Hypothetical predicted protein [Mytilus galloprovincialis]